MRSRLFPNELEPASPNWVNRALSKFAEGILSGAGKAIGTTLLVAAGGALVQFFGGGLAWSPILFGAAMAGLGSFGVTLFNYFIKSAKADVDAWEWRPSNSLITVLYSCELRADGTVLIGVRLINVSPLDWVVDGGRLEHVRIGGTQLNFPLNLEGLPLSGALIRKKTSILLFFRGGAFTPNQYESMWSLISVGEDERTRTSTHPIPGGVISVVSPWKNDREIFVEPAQGAISLESRRRAMS